MNFSGATGPTGMVGMTGMTGMTGMIGMTGMTGAVGRTGATGAAAERGPPGANGAVGHTGATGATGLPGPVGETGEIGPPGAAGAMGLTGAAGDDGEIGLTGAVGPTGAAGDDGEVGLAGAVGLTGPDGEPGEVGLTGAVGPTGAAGAPGNPAGGSWGFHFTCLNVPFTELPAGEEAAITVGASSALAVTSPPGAGQVGQALRMPRDGTLQNLRVSVAVTSDLPIGEVKMTAQLLAAGIAEGQTTAAPDFGEAVYVYAAMTNTAAGTTYLNFSNLTDTASLLSGQLLTLLVSVAAFPPPGSTDVSTTFTLSASAGVDYI